MKCPNCQADNPEGSEFCGECGKPLKSESICQQCGHSNPYGKKFCNKCGQPLTVRPAVAKKPKKPSTIQPTSFADGRYQVKKFLGEGGKKKVYLAHDTLLDRDVAFALIKTENLDNKGKKRIAREARAMGRLGDHPNISTVFDIGEYEGQPYIVGPFIGGGDIESLIEKAPEHKLPIEQVIKLAKEVCQGLIFAHSKSIVHRDIKPGNVMLTEDGTAKIVDFGLAVAIDLSRLTQSGMMVGTYSYMPPEQAMGGQVSEKADLYSLGAMLYEMVTGRPPFVGDDSVSIIGQHISNTPPVSPTWHRADLPPALETLILQLLEKDPEKRPDSARVVLEALESIEAGKISKESTIEVSTVTENPLYRRVFVGREREQKQLQDAFNSALSGQGSLMMVVGEPGIGKTALTEQLSTWVKLRGGRTLVGHCYEEGSLSLPYLAFVEAMRSYVLIREVKDLREELGTGAADVARIVSEIREKLKVKPRPKADPEEERYRLMQGVSDFLHNAANVQPLLIVLEDLHDADKGTLDMLIHVSRHVGSSRLLLIGTYRDVEVDRTHPLSATLAELKRLATYGRVILRGLNADEVRRMLEGITREEVPWSLAEAVHRQTEGNPLFVQEVVRYLVEEGLLTQQEGKYKPTKDTPLEMSIPEGLRDVIGKRLSLISKECNQLLSVAAVIGREFALETLQVVSDINDNTFVEALKEAVQLSILEERLKVGQIKYRFTHAFFRQTLYEELIAPQRLKLHQQVARSLEKQYANRLQEHAAELAEHFSQSTDAHDLQKAIEYGKMAAKRAADVCAYGEAVRLLEQALKVLRVLDPEDKIKQCDLLLILGETMNLAGESRRALDIPLPEAFLLAEDIADKERASQACILSMTALIYHHGGGILSFGTSEASEWLERADRYAGQETTARAWADASIGEMKVAVAQYTGQPAVMNEGVHLIDKAFKLARRLDDTEAFCHVAAAWLLHVRTPHMAVERLQVVEELVERLKSGVTLSTFTLAQHEIIDTLLEYGRQQEAEEHIKILKKTAERSEQPNLILLSMLSDAFHAFQEGRLEGAEEIGQHCAVLGEQLGIPEFGAVYGVICGWQPRLLLGKSAEALSQMERFPLIYQAPHLAELGRKAEVEKILEQWVVKRPGVGTSEDMFNYLYDVFLLSATVNIKHRKAAELLLNRFSESGLYISGILYPACVPRLLGAAAAIVNRPEEARQYYQEAIRVCTEMPFRPELALSKLQLAELLLEHYPDEKKEALEHLDFAIKEFREMKMQPSLERALRHKDILKA
jgi:tetratricopeptide (TPR) repeat protein